MTTVLSKGAAPNLLPGLFDLPAPHAVRSIALGFLDDAIAAHARLESGADAEALHDFRVALRRLRSWLRKDAWTGGHSPKKILRRIRRIARATNRARETEVLIEWAESQRPMLSARQRRALPWLTEWIAAGEDKQWRDAATSFRSLAPGWRESLAIVRLDEYVDAPESLTPFRAFAGVLLAARTEALAAALEAIRGASDTKAIHAARLAGKRLRYTLEPLAGNLPGDAEIVERMKGFQDDLGRVCDRHAFVRVLAKAVGEAAKRAAREQFAEALRSRPAGARATPSAVPGLATLARLANEEMRARYRLIRSRYLADRGGALLQPVRTATTGIGAAGA